MIGSNEEAARRAGIAVDRHKNLSLRTFRDARRLRRIPVVGTVRDDQYRWSPSRQSSGDHSCGARWACVSLHGGIGTMIGTVIGVFIPAILTNGFTIVGLSASLQEVAVGAVLIGNLPRPCSPFAKGQQLTARQGPLSRFPAQRKTTTKGKHVNFKKTTRLAAVPLFATTLASTTLSGCSSSVSRCFGDGPACRPHRLERC